MSCVNPREEELIISSKPYEIELNTLYRPDDLPEDLAQILGIDKYLEEYEEDEVNMWIVFSYETDEYEAIANSDYIDFIVETHPCLADDHIASYFDWIAYLYDLERGGEISIIKLGEYQLERGTQVYAYLIIEY